jgi:hypothetical protein
MREEGLGCGDRRGICQGRRLAMCFAAACEWRGIMHGGRRAAAALTGAGGEGKKKKKKKKKGKKKAADGGEGAAEGAAAATGGAANGSGGAGAAPKDGKQTEPPSVPVRLLFPGGKYPEGEWQVRARRPRPGSWRAREAKRLDASSFPRHGGARE